MQLIETEITSFRNYKSLHMKWSPHTNILYGMNAQGKTNLLESIYFLSLTKSHRTTQDKELIHFGDSFSLVKGRVERNIGSVQLEVLLTNKGKKVKINGAEQRRLSDFIGMINVVLFAPEDLELIKGTPQVRRKFLDMEIGQVNPAYLYYLNRYNKILLQRNHGLKEIAKGKMNQSLIGAWDEQLALYAPKIWRKRLDFLKKLSSWADEIHRRITDGKEKLLLHYQGSIPLEEQPDEERLREEYFEVLQSKAERDVERGFTQYGPHRDDLLFTIDGNEVQSFGSQGQQRTVALSLKLAEIELIREEIGEYPVLLLDDVFSELDVKRQTHLITGFWEKCQTFITTTGVEAIPIEFLKMASLYHIENGKVSVEGR
ncbi:MAG: DNA replication/repair protein RecF [Thermicanus sp.]|nr:DNA replication/repair protein RecF [Thermicanus sp.]